MKKASHILIALILLLSTMGISITRHYCGEVLSKVYISSPEKHCCGDTEPDGCCHSESDRISLENEFKLQSFDNLLEKTNLPVIADLHELEHQCSTYISFSSETISYDNTSPPWVEHSQAIFQVFRL